MGALTRGVAAVGEEGLACDPGAVGDEEADDGRNVLHLGEAPAHALALVEGDRLGLLLRVEEGCARPGSGF